MEEGVPKEACDLVPLKSISSSSTSSKSFSESVSKVGAMIEGII